LAQFSGDYLIEQFRSTESDDSRITETSDVRITELENQNSAVASMVANGTHLVFDSESYYNESGTWKTFVPYVNDGGEWKIPAAIYRHNGSRWLRIR
jgi:hypothetical protein